MIVKMMRLPAVLAVSGLGRSTVYEQMSRGEFPQPVKLGARAVAWPESAIAEWLANRPASGAE